VAVGAAETIADAGVGLVWLGAGAVAYRRVGPRRAGLSMLVTGAAWMVGGLVPSLVLLHRGPLAHALLAFPRGALGGTIDRLAVAAIALEGAVLAVGGSAAGTVTTGVLLAGAAGRDWLHGARLARRRRSVALGAAVAIGAVAQATLATAREKGIGITKALPVLS
jgi:hypothetical protein